MRSVVVQAYMPCCLPKDLSVVALLLIILNDSGHAGIPLQEL